MMFYTDIIENEKGKIYIGMSENPLQRVDVHNKMTGDRWTKGKGPWILIHQEEHSTKEEALARERYLKSLKVGKRIKKILHIES